MQSAATVIWKSLLNIQRTILITCSLFIIIGISLNVVFRYILEKSLFGIEEIIVVFAFWLYFIGGSYGSYERSHITADITNSYITNEKIRLLVKAVVSLITLVICLVFTYWAVEFIVWAIQQGAESPALHIPAYIPQSAIFIGFILMSFYLSINFIQDVIAFFQTRSKEKNE
ncbi:TRAP transporter small permease [Bacillus piscicola]|uniref:TRAP transporter small permease n=1 Tax=Bacillus piscicola TaxID=1632684 RepID=UPI001F098260|nr:TRAP transporter small permease [Bacillus piscicola]